MAFHSILGVVKLHRHPAPRFEDAVIFLETLGHQPLVVGQALTLGLVFDGLGPVVREDPEPRLPEEVQFGVHQVAAEGWVGEDVVDGIAWYQ
jgi:hypothetical protein